jgi:hypothetical protein
MIHVGLRAHPTAIRTAQLKNDANFIFTVLSFSYAQSLPEKGSQAYRRKVRERENAVLAYSRRAEVGSRELVQCGTQRATCIRECEAH